VARIPVEELARLKREVDLASLVRASGVDLSPVGEDLRGLCPFHPEETPSLVVTPAKGLWHCFGCDLGGSAVDWVMRSEHVSFRHAVEVLRAKVPSLAAGEAGEALPKRLPSLLPFDADDQVLLNQVIAFYHETLKETPEALAYLAKRGLSSSEMVERFKLGYAERTLGYRLPSRESRAGVVMRARLAKVGIMRETGHEHFAGSLVIPVLDEQGNVLGVYGRKTRSDLREGTPLHMYLKGPHRGVWNVEALSASREVILCEALIDALSFWCAGYRNVTTSYGVCGFTDEILAAMKKHGTEKVLIAYDRDDAGDKAAEDLAPRLAEAGIDVYRVLFPRGMDANDYAQRNAPASESLGAVIRSAQFVVKGRRAGTASPSIAASPSTTDPSPEPVADEAAKGKGSEGCEEIAASPEPASDPSLAAASLPLAAPSLVVRGEEVEMVVGDRLYRVRDLWRNLSLGRMEVNVRVSRAEKYYVDTFDLLKARPRELYTKQAADELAVTPEVVKKDLGKLLLELEALQQKRIQKATTPTPKGVEIPEAEKAEAFALLRDPRLLDRIVEAFDRIGLVGERTNKLVGYLAAVSRKLAAPLALLIQSNSAAGKSALMDAILELAPPEDVERYTAMTGQSLYYMADTDLKHRVLAIAEVAGADRAGYAIKMLQSEGRISIATTVKDPDTGEMKTKKHEVEGPVAIMLTTTEAEIDEELQNRALVLTVNEDREQTRAIHEAQRRAETLEGILAAEDRLAVVRLHRNAQRLLRPLRVVNPFAEGLAFPDVKLRTRRDHVKYLTLIRSIALLSQYQRPIKQETRNGHVVPYIEVTPSDIETAKRLADEVLGQSLDDLAPQTRRLLGLLDEMVSRRCAERKVAREDLRFTRREVREYTNWGDTQLRVHLARLVDLELLLIHRGSRGHSFVYELLYDGRGQDGRPFVVGLVDPRARAPEYDARLAGGEARNAGSEERNAASPRPHRGPIAGGSRGPENGSGAVLSRP